MSLIEVITKALRKHNLLKSHDTQFEQLLQLNPDAILLIDSKGDIKKANPEALRLLDSIELPPERYEDLLDKEVKRRLQAKAELRNYEMECINGSKRLFLLVNTDYMNIDNELHALLFLRDLTLLKQKMEEIELLAYHDPLTRLPNRRHFQEKLNTAIQEALRLQESLIVMLIDLDKFKLFNDTSGHLAGDMALQQVARILGDVAADRGIAARMNGDEFILYISGSPSQQETQAHIQYIQEEFARSIAELRLVPIDLNIGVSSFPSDGTDAQALINNADHAMLEMKRSRT